MKIGQTLLEALESLTANKMRSGLTVLGIIIGVAAVIALMAIGNGTQSSITSQIEGIGVNLLFVSSGAQLQSQTVRNVKPLTLADANALLDSNAAPDVQAVAPIIQANSEVSVNGQSARETIYGITPSYGQVSNDTVTEGDFISEQNVNARSAVAVIGPDTAQNLFGRTENVVGQTIRVGTTPFRVIGVLASKGGSGFGNQDDRVLVPLTTAQVRLSRRQTTNAIDQIEVQASSSEGVTAAQDEITQILRARHKTAEGSDDFTIRTQEDILSTATTITGTMTAFLGGIAAISLLVGGIGIMNIMLVSVSERTREIGLRKALGARKRDILVQFLVELMVLSLTGGVLGILVAWLLTLLISGLIAASGSSIQAVISGNSILLATVFSMSVGLLFGLYPANRAANLQPVEALRYE